jgi:hypothetical protein
LTLPRSQARQFVAMSWTPYAFSRPVLKRNLLIALFVGCALSLSNQYDALFSRQFTSRLAVKVFMNFIIPFAVSTVSAVLNRKVEEP